MEEAEPAGVDDVEVDVEDCEPVEGDADDADRDAVVRFGVREDELRL